MENNYGYKNPINWFPGHMAKTRRLISDSLRQVDIVIELLDARIPKSSKNPEIDALAEGKPRLVILTKSSLADPESTSSWIRSLTGSGKGTSAIAADIISGEGTGKIVPEIKRILAEKLRKYEEKGMSGRRIKAMIVGIPNVGKSSLANRLVGRKKAKAENRPGVTQSKQWIQTDSGLDLLDTPGILWPKLGDRTTAENLAFTGAIKDAILDTEELAASLCARLMKVCPALFSSRYRLDAEEAGNLEPRALLEAVARKRGFLLRGGDPDTERAADTVLSEFREGKIGRITLERPGEGQTDA